MELYDVVKKLLGPINPIGSSETDEARFENLKITVSLVNDLLCDIGVVAAENKMRNGWSQKQAGEYANSFLTKLGIAD